MRPIQFKLIILAYIMQLAGQQAALAAENEKESSSIEEVITSSSSSTVVEHQSAFDQALEAFTEEYNSSGRKRSLSIPKSGNPDSQGFKKQRNSQKSAFRVALIKAKITSYEEIIRNYDKIIKKENDVSLSRSEDELSGDELHSEVVENEGIENSEVVLTQHAIKDGIAGTIFLKRERVKAAP
jgi:hypothetical protein